MNKNKIIFWILWAIIIAILVFWVYLLNASTNKAKTSTPKGQMSIWVLRDSAESFAQVIADFKSKNPSFTNASIKVESFSSTREYFLALASAFVNGKTPDIFVMQSDEKSIFRDQITGLSPSKLNPQDFRKNFKEFFGDTLIQTTTPKWETPIEFVSGVPVGYETLGIFYNRKYFQAKDMTSWGGISEASKTLSDKNSTLVPLAIGNGSITPEASDIMTQFLMLDGAVSLESLESKGIKEWLATYLSYGDAWGTNRFNTKLLELQQSGKNALDIFASEDTAAVIGYPRMIAQIDTLGFRKSFLFATPFPHFTLTKGKSLTRYSYFVINKSTPNYEFAESFLAYLASEAGAKKYLTTFPYYLPALVNLEAESLNQKISSNYNIVLKDFYNSDVSYGAFDKSIAYVYDEALEKILDDSINAVSKFEQMKKDINCLSNKIIKFEGLSSSCGK
jgi:ABC-type glycerol-3-phosphate transport system substrate-binding protein